jgi:hypothetical protein
VKSQVLPFGHVAVAFAGGVQVVQVPPQRRNPELQLTPQVEALLQTSVEFGSDGHKEQDEGPQLLTFALGTHVWPQRCWPLGQVQVVPLHAAPAGHSELIRQPTEHWRVVGSQLNPGAHPPAATQSVGSGRHVPEAQTCPELHWTPHPPQLFSSLS